MTEADSLGGSFDQTRDIRHDKALAAVDIHNSQMRIQSGEMVIGDLGTGVADAGNQRGFTHVWKSHETDIRDDLEFQLDPELLAGLSRLGVFRCLHGWSGVMHVALTAAAAF